MNMLGGFRAVLYKETLQIRRDRITLFLTLLIPMFQLLMFGYAINTNVRNIKTVVYNLDKRQHSRRMLDAFANTQYFQIVQHVGSDRQLNDAIVSGRAKIGIKIPADYSERILRRQPATVLVLIDGSDSSIASQAVAVSNAVGLRQSLEVLLAGGPATGSPAPIEVRPKMLFNPDMRSTNFMVPGLIAIILQIVTTFLTAFSLVRERERGTLEQLLVTPVKPLGLVLGKLTPYCIIAFLETCGVLLVMYFIFRVPINGSLLLLLSLSVLYLVTALGIGLLISTKAVTQVQAMQMAYPIMLPSVLLSGFMFPRESMPAVMQWVGNLVPATYFIDIMRGIVLRGASWAQLWPDAMVLVVMALLFVGLSVLRLRRKLA